MTRVRLPDGMGGERFFEKNVPRGTPAWVRHRTLRAAPGGPDEGKTVDLPFLDELDGLVWALNLGALELHTPQWRVGPRGGVPTLTASWSTSTQGRPQGSPGASSSPGSSQTGCAPTGSRRSR